MAFLVANDSCQWVSLDGFEDDAGQVDVLDAGSEVDVDEAGSTAVYSLTYTPLDCDEYKVQMTTEGHVSVHGCCGK